MDEIERSNATVRQSEDAFNHRDYSLEEIVGGALEGHNPGSNDVTVEGLQANNQSWYTAMPDKRTEIGTLFGGGDRVVARIQDRGTNTGGLPWCGIVDMKGCHAARRSSVR